MNCHIHKPLVVGVERHALGQYLTVYCARCKCSQRLWSLYENQVRLGDRFRWRDVA